jgi:hypothetical protein
MTDVFISYKREDEARVTPHAAFAHPALYAPTAKTAQMAWHPLALGKAFHRLGAHPDVELLAQPLVRHAVVAVNLDVTVDMDSRLLPLRVCKTLTGQGTQCRPLNTVEQRSA